MPCSYRSQSSPLELNGTISDPQNNLHKEASFVFFVAFGWQSQSQRNRSRFSYFIIIPHTECNCIYSSLHEIIVSYTRVEVSSEIYN